MKKILCYLGTVLTVTYLLVLSSCGNNDEFSSENTFNLESLEVDPPANINDNFIVTYGVTTKGFPQFLFDIYLSDDADIDGADLKIAEGRYKPEYGCDIF